MALKRNLTDDEKYGLTQEEIRRALKYLRKNKTAGAISETESLKLFEMYLIGSTLNELAQQFPQYEVDQIIFTAAFFQWARDRDKMTHSLRDRVRAKVVKSVIEQVDFLTTLLSVSNAEHLSAMRSYAMDPINNPKPSMRIMEIKQYKDVAETLYKIVAGATPGSNNKTSPMFDALSQPVKPGVEEKIEREQNILDMVDDGNEQ